MTKTIVFANEKGGVGKTTITTNLGLILANKGYRVLFVDLDKQATLTEYFLQGEGEHNFLDSAYNDIPLVSVIQKFSDQLYLLPANRKLINADIVMNEDLDWQHSLKRILDPVAKKFDFILIDSPGSLGKITINSFIASDYVAIVNHPAKQSMIGNNRVFELAEKVKSSGLNPNLTVLGAIFNEYNGYASEQTELESFKESCPDLPIFETKLRRTVQINKAFKNQDSADTLKSKVAEEYIALTEEIIKKVED